MTLTQKFSFSPSGSLCSHFEADYSSIYTKLNEDRLTKAIPLLSICNDLSDIEELKSVAQKIKDNCNHLVIIGTGGSSLNGSIWTDFSNLVDFKISYLDRIDPIALNEFLALVDLEDTMFLCISKSGRTLEVVSLTILIIQNLLSLNFIPREKIICITDIASSPLRNIIEYYQLTSLNHANVGGRYSTFTNVGMLPALLMNLDIVGIRHTAQEFINRELAGKSELVLDCVKHSLTTIDSGKNISVVMPYLKSLYGLSMWYRQMVAESLGKNGQGQTLLHAMGSIDQHSQLQLFLEGPRDKYFTFISTPIKLNSPTIVNPPVASLNFLHGKSIDDICKAEERATINSILAHKAPVRELIISDYNEYTIAELAAYFILEIIVTARTLNINPFDQPAVESSKRMAYDLLS